MKTLNQLNSKKLLSVTVLCWAIAHSHGEFIDKMDSTDNFRLFNSTIALYNGDGTILFARPGGSKKDVIADWQRGNKGFAPLKIDTENNRLIVVPKANYNAGWYSVNIRLFDSKKKLLGEPIWIKPTQSIKKQILLSIIKFAQAKGFPTAQYFTLRFRFGPWAQKSRGMIFDEIKLLNPISNTQKKKR
jgi:hypothetical protein